MECELRGDFFWHYRHLPPILIEIRFPLYFSKLCNVLLGSIASTVQDKTGEDTTLALVREPGKYCPTEIAFSSQFKRWRLPSGQRRIVCVFRNIAGYRKT